MPTPSAPAPIRRQESRLRRGQRNHCIGCFAVAVCSPSVRREVKITA
jgi:hypothetical protein